MGGQVVKYILLRTGEVGYENLATHVAEGRMSAKSPDCPVNILHYGRHLNGCESPARDRISGSRWGCRIFIEAFREVVLLVASVDVLFDLRSGALVQFGVIHGQ